MALEFGDRDGTAAPVDGAASAFGGAFVKRVDSGRDALGATAAWGGGDSDFVDLDEGFIDDLAARQGASEASIEAAEEEVRASGGHFFESDAHAPFLAPPPPRPAYPALC